MGLLVKEEILHEQIMHIKHEDHHKYTNTTSAKVIRGDGGLNVVQQCLTIHDGFHDQIFNRQFPNIKYGGHLQHTHTHTHHYCQESTTD